MSARRQIIAALSEDSLGGIATLQDVDNATQLADAHRAEVLNEGADVLHAEVVRHAHRALFGDGIRHAEQVVRGLTAGAGEKATPAGAAVTPQAPVFDPLPGHLHAIGQAGSQYEQALYAAYRQAVAEVARLQAETGADQPAAGEATPDFFQPGRTYLRFVGDRELYFRVSSVSTDNPNSSSSLCGDGPVAYGWSRTDRSTTVWGPSGQTNFVGWHDVTEAGDRS